MPVALFPSEPLSPRVIDPDFAAEEAAARAAGFQTALLDHARVVEGAATQAAARVPENAGPALYRGWMLSPSQYEAMYSALRARGIVLVNDPEQYRTCHYLPESYRFLEGKTPRSVWVPLRGDVDFEAMARAVSVFGDRPIVVKDYVKSQKHYWNEACFILSASDAKRLERVVRRFLELQGQELNEGLVFREFVPLKIVGTHPNSNLPLAAEFRIFWLDTEPIVSHRYWGDLTTFDRALPFEELRPIAEKIPSRFFTMDVAFLDDGDLTIVELGDGQVAGLPSLDLAPEFFRRVGDALTSNAVRP